MRKWFRLILSLVVLLGGAVLCAIRWNAWFGNAPEPLYLVDAAPHSVVLTLGENAVSQRTVTWCADTLLNDSYLLLQKDKVTDTLQAEGVMVASRAGKAAYYKVELDSLEEGEYKYSVCSGTYQSEQMHFSVWRSDTVNILLMGDIQSRQNDNTFASWMAEHSFDDVDMMAYVGDVIERPTDEYWQIWLQSMQGQQALTPQMATPGNHEYLKGIRKTLDSRWKYIFVNPQNGPRRFAGTTYYVDYPLLRVIFIDTDALLLMSDYTITQSWLVKTLMEAGDRWTIVVMHHALHSAGMMRENVAIYSTFHRVLDQADLVVAGHDHVYTRRSRIEDFEKVTPVNIVTSSADKYYIPKCHDEDQRIGCNTAFYEDICVTADTLHILTRILSTGEIYDDIRIDRDGYVHVSDSLMPEMLELPDQYKNENSVRVRRFENRRAVRQRQ